MTIMRLIVIKKILIDSPNIYIYLYIADNTKFNTPAPHSHPRPCNTNESHDTGERKWLIGPNLDIFT